MYLCPNCLKIYKHRPKKLICTNCNSESYIVFEVDDIFILPIKMLNEKGYKTTMCCSGHFGEHNFTHSIIDLEGVIKLNSLPKNYTSKIEYIPYSKCVVTRIEREIHLNDEIKFQKELFQNANNVIDWVNSLPRKDD